MCDPCKKQNHKDCPNMHADDPKKPPTGLSAENNVIQRSGLCPCQHRVPQEIDEAAMYAQIHKSRSDMISVGIVPPPCPCPDCNVAKEAISEQVG